MLTNFFVSRPVLTLAGLKLPLDCGCNSSCTKKLDCAAISFIQTLAAIPCYLWKTERKTLELHTVRPISHIHLTRLQKRNRAWWQMLFHPTALRSEFCNPLTFGQIHPSCAFCALPGWNMTQKICLLLHHWSILSSPSMQYFILIGWKSPVLPGPDIVFRLVHK